ncbi:CbtA family protein [Bradyrhizobium sp. Leo121]|uniref:CbtA family protein n=1 Tax=Bradyrhizobium sp. Leo121 TaxID=1571195 RepID=UPI00102A8101|nr:CbtA family protein [Bradyrhizobium sp. Leo121]RZN35966.1 cobalt transporter [Bradyrhizobium sp. Leo121]
MHVFRSIVFAASLAGLIVGALISVVQFFGTVPMIQKSEVFEKAAADAHHKASHAGSGEADHHHDAEWEPDEGFQRSALTVAANVLTAIGFGLLLTGIYALRQRPVHWREGLFWGLAGFAVFVAAPGLGLPPELPGLPVADLTARQIWWIATAALTASALYLLILRSEPWAAVLGVILIVIPHLVGAPVAPESHAEVPASLSHQFVVTVVLTGLLFWSLLGVATSLAFDRVSRKRS